MLLEMTKFKGLMRQFTLEFWKDEDWYVGRLLEVPGVFSQGETVEELKKNIQDAYQMLISSEDVSFVPPTASRISLELANFKDLTPKDPQRKEFVHGNNLQAEINWRD